MYVDSIAAKFCQLIPLEIDVPSKSAFVIVINLFIYNHEMMHVAINIVQ